MRVLVVAVAALALVPGCAQPEPTYVLRATYTIDGANNGTEEVQEILGQYDHGPTYVQESWPPTLVVTGLAQGDCVSLRAELNATGHFRSVRACAQESPPATGPQEPVGSPGN